MANVPRISDITGKPSNDDVAAKREWDAARKRYRCDSARYTFGTKESKEAWQRRIAKTRSF